MELLFWKIITRALFKHTFFSKISKELPGSWDREG